MKILVHTHTIIKARPLAAQELQSHEKIEVPVGVSFLTSSNIDDLENGHYRMQLNSDLGSGDPNRRDFWYVPKVHVDILQCIAKVKTEGLNFRIFPNPRDSTNIIQKLSLGTFVEIFDGNYINTTLGLWWCGRPICTAEQHQIWSPELQVGWMSSKHLELTDLKVTRGNRGGWFFEGEPGYPPNL
ncbi:hypothetical protein [Geitlerinema sp. P-1104]|uniref:hypothetical protein n=1 Tax=Geitlerinema sp. P-1104 TaxID=2546230 RepID=UPI0025704261|nr:hypothetical protein [Geitlerinema sp. P-1104]